MRFIVSTLLWDIGADRTDALVIVCSDRVWKSRVAGAVPNTLSGFANVFFYPFADAVTFGENHLIIFNDGDGQARRSPFSARLVDVFIQGLQGALQLRVEIFLPDFEFIK
jgi:hypothetical protein